MDLSARIEQDYIIAYKAKDSLRLSVLRLVKTAAKNMLVECRRPGGELSDGEWCAVLMKQAKQRQDSIEQFCAASRRDLADKEESELRILQEYLPKPLSTEELDAAINTAIAETEASSPKDMGRVMQKLTTEYAGRVDGKSLSGLVRAKLASHYE